MSNNNYNAIKDFAERRDEIVDNFNTYVPGKTWEAGKFDYGIVAEAMEKIDVGQEINFNNKIYVVKELGTDYISIETLDTDEPIQVKKTAFVESLVHGILATGEFKEAGSMTPEEAMEAVNNLEPGQAFGFTGVMYVIKSAAGDYATVETSNGETGEVARNALGKALVKGVAPDLLKKSDGTVKAGIPENVPSTIAEMEKADAEKEKAFEATKEKLKETFTEGWQKLRASEQLELLLKVFPEYAEKAKEYAEKGKLAVLISSILNEFGLDVPKFTKEDLNMNKDKDGEGDEESDKGGEGDGGDDEKLPENLQEQIDPRIKIGSFVKLKQGRDRDGIEIDNSEATIFEITNLFEKDGKAMVTIQAFDDRGKEKLQLTDSPEPMTVDQLLEEYSMHERSTLLAEMQSNFLAHAEDSFRNAGALEKFKFEFARLLKGEKMETGLSAEARESLDRLNSYLNKLISSAEREWRNKGKSPEEIKALSERYKAKYMSGIQLEAEYGHLYEEKIKNSETRVGRFLGKIRDKWKKIPTKYKVIGAVAGVATLAGGAAFLLGAGATAIAGSAALAGSVPAAGIGGSSFFTKKAGRTAGAWAGLGITYTMRGFLSGGAAPLVLAAAVARTSLESAHLTKGDTKGMANIRKNIEALTNAAKKIREHLAKEDLSRSDKDRLNIELNNIHTTLQQQERSFKNQAGQFDQDMQSVQERYNRAEITPKEYLAELERYKMKDEIMETLKSGLTLFALGAAAGSMIGGGGEITPEPEPEIEPVVVPEQPDINPHEVDANSLGSIKTIELLQDKYLSSGEPLPPVLDGTPEELAERYDFWNPEDIDESSNILKGEKYGVNENGELYQTHLDGTKEILANAKGEMVDGGYDGDYFDFSAPHGDTDVKSVEYDPLAADSTGSVEYDPFKADTTGSVEYDPFKDAATDSTGSVEYDPFKDASTTATTTEEAASKEYDPLAGKDATTETGEAKGTETAKKVGPSEVLTSKADVPTDVLQAFDKFDEGLTDREYETLVNTPVSTYIEGLSGSSMSAEQLELRDIVTTIQGNTGLEPLPYESAKDFINRGLEELGSPANIDQIHAGEAYTGLSLETAEFVGNTKQATFNNFRDIYFDRSGGAWHLEGEQDISFKDIGSRQARDVFYKIGQGEVTVASLQKDLGISGPAAAKLFDFFNKVRDFTEASVGVGAVDANMSIEDAMRDMAGKLTEDAKRL